MKRTKTVFVGLILLLVAGCSDIPTDDQYASSRSWCDQFGGVKTSEFGELKGLRVRCLDGTLIAKHFSN